jgi:hypothetical protein
LTEAASPAAARTGRGTGTENNVAALSCWVSGGVNISLNAVRETCAKNSAAAFASVGTFPDFR